jgi:hypothetical protein
VSGRGVPDAPRVPVDARRAAELASVPAVVAVDKRLAAGDVAGAVRAAFPLVMMDVQRAYGVTFPPHWTSRDVLAHGLRPDMGRLPDLLLQLHALYEPVRFGTERDWVAGDVRGLVVRIYTETSLRALAQQYALHGGTTFSVLGPGAAGGAARSP